MSFGSNYSNKIKQEYDSIQKSNAWFNLFQDIKEKSEEEAKKQNFSMTACRQVQNRKLNRYRDVNPYDHSRIILKRNNIDSDYINASLVKHCRAKRSYILCQGPLPNTVPHFWLMIWENQSKAILMLNKIIEKKQIKCHPYWPKKKEKLELHDVGLQVEFVKSQSFKNFSKRIFLLTDTESLKSREVIQFHYTSWPDFGVPDSPTSFLQFLKQVRDSDVLDENVVIHCSAGIGRSGTFCVVDCCLVLAEQKEDNISIQEVLLELRRGRMGLIQTHDQLSFSYEAVIEGVQRLENDTFEELNSLEISNESDEDENAPPVPPRTLSNTVPRIALPNPSVPIISDSSSDSSESTSSDVSTIPEDHSDDENFSENIFDPNSKLPPIPSNGKLEISHPGLEVQQEEERNSSNNDPTNELRHRQRNSRNEAMKEKIREIKRKTKEAESWPKKRRSLLISIVSGVFVLSFVSYLYVYVKS